MSKHHAVMGLVPQIVSQLVSTGSQLVAHVCSTGS